MEFRKPSITAGVGTAALLILLGSYSPARAAGALAMVPGTADPYLAGMPNGTACCGGDTAPAESPVLTPGLVLTPSAVVTFSVTGSMNVGGGTPSDPPDGGSFYGNGAGANNGIAAANIPLDALVGVFLDNNPPNTSAAPAGLDFSLPGAMTFTTLAPGLKQVFFIGDGLSGKGSGSVQKFIVPAGATRLYLGGFDAFGWYNNSGSFTVTVSITSPVASYYFADLAFGGGLQTTVTYINYSTQTVTCVTDFFSDPGSLLPIPFSQGTVSSRTDTLQPGQSIHDQTVANPAAPIMQGWAQASCTGPVQASVLYRVYQSGAPIGEAGVNAETAPTTEFVTFAQTATGVAYANPSPTQSATITIAAYSTAGTKLASRVVTLGPLGHDAKTLGPFLGLPSFTGFVKITSTISIISLSLNFEAYPPAFSSLPPGDLPGSTTLVP